MVIIQGSQDATLLFHHQFNPYRSTLLTDSMVLNFLLPDAVSDPSSLLFCDSNHISAVMWQNRSSWKITYRIRSYRKRAYFSARSVSQSSSSRHHINTWASTKLGEWQSGKGKLNNMDFAGLNPLWNRLLKQKKPQKTNQNQTTLYCQINREEKSSPQFFIFFLFL